MTELKLYSTIAVQPVLEILVPRFEMAQGVKIAVVWGTAPQLVKRLQGNETGPEYGDVLLLNRAGIDAMLGAHRLMPESVTPIASSATAIAVKEGAARPDISSEAALKRSLQAATAISYSHPDNGGASGIYFAKLLDRWGLREAIDAKTSFPPPGGLSAQFLPGGEVAFAIQQVPELLQVQGVEIVGPLPGDLHFVTHFVAGIEKQSAQADLAKAFIAFLVSPEAKALFRDKGLDPA